MNETIKSLLADLEFAEAEHVRACLDKENAEARAHRAAHDLAKVRDRIRLRLEAAEQK